MKIEVIKDPTIEKICELLKDKEKYVFCIDTNVCSEYIEPSTIVNGFYYLRAVSITVILEICEPKNADRFIVFVVEKQNEDKKERENENEN